MVHDFTAPPAPQTRIGPAALALGARLEYRLRSAQNHPTAAHRGDRGLTIPGDNQAGKGVAGMDPKRPNAFHKPPLYLRPPRIELTRGRVESHIVAL